MAKGIRHAGIFTLGVGTFVYLYHKSWHGHLLHAVEVQDTLTNIYCQEVKPVRGKAAVPKEIAQEGPLVLKLIQVQVMFRHGARAPLYLVPKLDEANYEQQYLSREHQASLFPYEKILICSGEKADWSDLEKQMMKTKLKSGVSVGSLTAYGKDQMYMLGKTLQANYRDSLNLATYDPKEVFVFSSSFRRTVESARCTLAGFFGKYQLKTFAETCFPLNIFITDSDYNILVPDTENCNVLKKVNYTSTLNSDSIPGFKDIRLVIENKINKEREKNLDCVKKIQEKIASLCKCLKLDDSNGSMTTKENEYRQSYLYDPVLHPLVEERSKAIAKIDRLWIDAMVRNQYLSQVITENDMKALIYLRRLEVERFDGMFRPGYRFHFYFDPNPYFYNEHLCKEVYLNSPCNAKPSWSIPIMWKKNANLMTEIETSEETMQPPPTKENSRVFCKKRRKKKKNTKKVSFFHWYTHPTCEQDDRVGKTIRDEVWQDPIKALKGHRKHPDKWDSNISFIAARDDSLSRAVHGLTVPKILKDFEKIIDTNAAKMLYYSVNGLTSAERCVVTRLSAGPLLTYMVNMMDNTIKGKKCAPKLCLYSSHDSTITAMIESLGIWSKRWPPFAADIRFELYKDVGSSEHYVRVLYCGEVQRIRCQQADYLHWRDFKNSISKYFIQEPEYRSLCCSDILEQVAKNIYIDEATQNLPAGK